MTRMWIVMKQEWDDSNPVFLVESEAEASAAIKHMGKGHYAMSILVRHDWAIVPTTA